MSQLFAPLTLGNLTLRNRIVVSPMCEYSAVDGVPNDWHLVHLGSRAVGGAGLVFTEATAFRREGRISPGDTGLWNDAQQAAWAAHRRLYPHARVRPPASSWRMPGARRSTEVPWRGGKALENRRMDAGRTQRDCIRRRLSRCRSRSTALGIQKVIVDFAASTRRAREAGFDVIEIHAAHGYLLHEFLSPLSNQRGDAYGGSLENRARLLREVVAAVRSEWPAPRPLFVRVSATDWVPMAAGISTNASNWRAGSRPMASI